MGWLPKMTRSRAEYLFSVCITASTVSLLIITAGFIGLLW